MVVTGCCGPLLKRRAPVEGRGDHASASGACGDRPPLATISETVVNLARMAGSVPSKRQPLPGDAILWNAWQVFKPMVRWEGDRLQIPKKCPQC